MSILPEELLKQTGLKATGLCSHSDDVTSNDVFIAAGSAAAYAGEALKNGALAVIYQLGDKSIPAGLGESDLVFGVTELEDFVSQLLALVYGQDIENTELIGVTGTNGKTSCAYFSCQLLNLLGSKAGYIGTLGFGVVGEDLIASRNTTPDRVTLYRYISLLSRAGCKSVVMEVSSHGIALGRISGLKFTTGVFTNLSQDHLDFHGSMQAYEATKLAFFSDYSISNLVVNVDDQVGEKLATQWVGQSYSKRIFDYGWLDKNVTAYCRYGYNNNEMDISGCIEVRAEDSAYELTVNVTGRFNVENLVAAVMVCRAAGYQFEEIALVSEKVRPVPGRLECIQVSAETRAYVDYAHTPAGMESVLSDRSILSSESSEIWCVYGCGGDRDTGKRSIMGKVAADYANHVIVTDDNVRTEAAEKIICEILSGIDNKTGVVVCRDRAKAVEYAVHSMENKDMLFVLGKGDEGFIDYGSHKLPYSDVDAIKNSAAIR